MKTRELHNEGGEKEISSVKLFKDLEWMYELVPRDWWTTGGAVPRRYVTEPSGLRDLLVAGHDTIQ